ncbi:MAG: hypothetical protein EOO70_00785, partial [Myxococcaceae bacterium]
VSRPLSAAGDPTGVTVTDATAKVVFSAQQFPDPDGVVQGGEDPTGNAITYSGHETQALGLPLVATVTRTLVGAGGLGSYEVEYGYDVLGNRTSERNLATGAHVQLTYDAVGRLLTRTVAGTPAQSWTYDYQLADDALTVTQTLNLGRWGRSQSNTTDYQQGLKRAERYTYGLSIQSAVVDYDTYQGTRLMSFLDGRGRRHTLTYDSAGRVTGETVNGQTLYSNELDADGNVTEVTNSSGLKTRIEHDALGRPVRWAYESKGAGESCDEACQFADVETVVLDAAGAVKTRTFGTLAKPHVMDSVSDAMGRELSVDSNAQSHGGIHVQTTYDKAGRVLHRLDVETGLDETYAYDDALGRVTRYERTVQSVNGVRTLTETRAYTDSPDSPSTIQVTRNLSGGTPTEPADREEVRTYSVDAQGRILSVTETVDGQLSVHLMDYDALGREVESVDPSGRRTRREYDSAGNLLSVTWPGNVMTAFTHDAEGNVLTQSGPREDESWTLTYDDLGRLLSRTLNDQTPPAQWTYAYPGNGVETETEPEGTVIARTRNARGMVEHEVWKGGSSEERSIRTRYDGPWMKRQETREGDSVQVVARDQATAIDDRGRTRNEEESWSLGGYSYKYTTSTSWNGRDGSTIESWLMNNQNQGGRTVHAKVDSLGNMVRRTQAGAEDARDYYADGKPLRTQPFGFGSMEVTRWVYDTSGRVKVMRFGPEQTTYAYYADGLLRSETSPDTRVRTLTYNARGLPELETFGKAPDLSRTRFDAYDNAGHATEVRHAYGSADQALWKYKYGPRDELLQVTPPGLGDFKYTYDGQARLKRIEPPTGSVTPEVTYGYDFLGREKLRKRGSAAWSTTWTDGNPEVLNELSERVKRVVDGRGRVVHEKFIAGPATADASGALRVFKDLDSVDYVFNGLDQLRSAKEHRGLTQTVRSLVYDSRNRLESIGSGAETISYGYHDSGALKFVQSPSGTVNYDVGPLQRLSLVTLADGTALNVEWEAGGGRVAMVGNAALKHTYCHDSRGRLASVTHDARRENCNAVIGSPFLRYRYTYDERGNRLTEVVDRFQTETPGSTESTQYGYDAADRLTGVRYPEGQSVLYSLYKDGSRKAEKKVAGYAGALSEAGFEAASQPQEHLAYVYDALGGLKETRNELSAGAVVTQYQTDRAGRQVREQRGALTKLFHFDAAGRMVEAELTEGIQQRQVKYQYDFAGLRRSRTVDAAVTKYLWSGETLVEEHLQHSTNVLYQRGAGLTVAVGSERILQDGLGSAVGRVPSSGTATQHRFDAWGNYREGSGPTSAQASIGYTGHSWDAEAGLTYAQQRWYDSTTGRFLSLDPLPGSPMIPLRWNASVYVMGNPLRYVDPTGEVEDYVLEVSSGEAGDMLAKSSEHLDRQCRQGDQRACNELTAVRVVSGTLLVGLTAGMGMAVIPEVAVAAGGAGGGAVLAEAGLDTVGIISGAIGCYVFRDSSGCLEAAASTLDLYTGPLNPTSELLLAKRSQRGFKHNGIEPGVEVLSPNDPRGLDARLVGSGSIADSLPPVLSGGAALAVQKIPVVGSVQAEASAQRPVARLYAGSQARTPLILKPWPTEPNVQRFIKQFMARYPGRSFMAGHNRLTGDGDKHVEIDFETDNAVIEFKGGAGNGLQGQLDVRTDVGLNPAQKVLIGVATNDKGDGRMGLTVRRMLDEKNYIAADRFQIDTLIEVLAPDPGYTGWKDP